MFFSKLFKPKPFNQGYLPLREGHEIFFKEFGNPKGEVILNFHGGPGSGMSKLRAGNVNLKKYRLLAFDQRGCGNSLPKGELKNNNLQGIIDDANHLLSYLQVKGKVVVWGGSWGSTVALKFAEEFPSKVSKLVLSQIFLADKEYKKWELEDSSYFYPDILEKVKASNKTKKTLAKDALDKIVSGDVKKQLDAMSNYGGYEHILGCVDPKIEVNELDEFGLSYARIYLHYSGNEFFLKDRELIKNVDRIAHIPTLIVHNRLDLICPIKWAYELHQKMPKSKLVIVPALGHGGDVLHNAVKEELKEFL